MVTRQLTIPAEAIADVATALVRELDDTAERLRVELGEHQGGSQVSLTDARDALLRLGRLGAVLDALDPPGWAQTFARCEVA